MNFEKLSTDLTNLTLETLMNNDFWDNVIEADTKYKEAERKLEILYECYRINFTVRNDLESLIGKLKIEVAAAAMLYAMSLPFKFQREDIQAAWDRRQSEE